jgi:hypothetical protein
MGYIYSISQPLHIFHDLDTFFFTLVVTQSFVHVRQIL